MNKYFITQISLELETDTACV